MVELKKDGDYVKLIFRAEEKGDEMILVFKEDKLKTGAFNLVGLRHCFFFGLEGLENELRRKNGKV